MLTKRGGDFELIPRPGSCDRLRKPQPNQGEALFLPNLLRSGSSSRAAHELHCCKVKQAQDTSMQGAIQAVAPCMECLLDLISPIIIALVLLKMTGVAADRAHHHGEPARLPGLNAAEPAPFVPCFPKKEER